MTVPVVAPAPLGIGPRIERDVPGNPCAAPVSPRSPHPRTVLHLIAPAPFGGAETVVRLLATAQQAAGTRAVVAAVQSPDEPITPFLSALTDASLDVHRLVVPTRAYARERREIAALCRELSPCIVHSHGYRTDVIDALHVRGPHTPIVTTVHGFTNGSLRRRFYQWLQCRAYRRFDAVVAVSAPLRRQLAEHVAPEQLHFIPNAYAPSRESLSRAAARAILGLAEDAFLVGWVGRLSLEKGADILLEGLAHADAPRGVRAAILGDGRELASLRQRATRLGVAARVSWQGRVPQAERYLSAFDVLVLSSRTEGTPMILLEAMAAGVPIIATRVGGVPDLLSEGTALLIPAEAPSAVAAAIRSVCADPSGAAARASAASERLDRAFGVGAWVQQYDSVYDRVATQAGVPVLR